MSLIEYLGWPTGRSSLYPLRHLHFCFIMDLHAHALDTSMKIARGWNRMHTLYS